MASEITKLTTRNIVALGLFGFSLSFALFLLRGLWVGHASVSRSALDLAASVVLMAVCAATWPNVLRPPAARAPVWGIVAVALAVGLAVLARSPSIGG